MYKLFLPIILLLVSATPLLAQDDLLEIRKFKVEPDAELTFVSGIGGAIAVKGTNTEEVTLRVYGNTHKGRPYSIEQNNTGSSLTIKIKANSLKSIFNFDSDLSYTLEVPLRATVDVKTLGGNLTLSHLNGTISGETKGGNVSLSNLIGKADILTFGGNIEVENSQLEGRVKTFGGNIQLFKVIGGVEAKTLAGNVNFEQCMRQSVQANEPIKLRMNAGDVILGDAQAGADIRTISGNIEIERAADFLRLRTMHGDVEVMQLDGGADIAVTTGDIYLSVIEGRAYADESLNLVVHTGDIQLVLPRNYNCTVTVEQQLKQHIQEVEQVLKSDFTATNIDVVDESQMGYQQKIRKATYVIGDGSRKINIATKSGDIRVIKQ
jgi:hypothetical protein